MRPVNFPSLSVWLVVTLCVGTPWADECQVPSTPHPTLQSAVDDLTCTEIVLRFAGVHRIGNCIPRPHLERCVE